MFGALIWVLIFFEVSVLMFGLKLSKIPYYVTHYILSIAIVALISFLYFKGEKSDFGKGVAVGLVFSIIGIFLDLVITVPLFVKDYRLLFGDIGLWVGIVLGIITVGVIGALRKRPY